MTRSRLFLPLAMGIALGPLLVLTGCMTKPTEPPKPRRELLVTANENKVELPQGVATVMPANPSDSISIFDIGASPTRLLATVTVPTSIIAPPQSVALTPDLSLAIVSAATRFAPGDRSKTVDGDQLSVVDLQATPPAVVQTVTTGPAPASVAVSPDGSLVLVTTRGDSAVLVFALENKRLRQTARIALPDKSVPGGVAITPDGQRALVTRDGDHFVSVLSINRGEVKLAGRDFQAGVRPYGVHISPSDEWAVVGNVGRATGDFDTISLVDMRGANPRSVDHASVAPTVEGVAMAPNSRLVAAIAHDGTNRPPSNPFHKTQGQVALFRIDAGKLVPVARAPIGRWAQGIAFSPGSTRLFVQNAVERNVQVFRITADALIDTGERLSLPGGGAAMVVGAH